MVRLSVAAILFSTALLPANITIIIAILLIALHLHTWLTKAGKVANAITETLIRLSFVTIIVASTLYIIL